MQYSPESHKIGWVTPLHLLAFQKQPRDEPDVREYNNLIDVLCTQVLASCMLMVGRLGGGW